MTKSNGFTLVELAIALMVIGLLIGGVLKGQELIENAKATRIIRDIKAYDTAATVFKGNFGALPGDIKYTNRIPNCTTQNNDLCGMGGNDDGVLGRNFDAPIRESEWHNFFPHMTKAGLIQGPEGGSQTDINLLETQEKFYPLTSFDLYIGAKAVNLDNIYAIPLANAFSMASSDPPVLPVKAMQQIDTKLDDGKPLSGDVQVSIHSFCPVTNGVNQYHTDDTENDGCTLYINVGF